MTRRGNDQGRDTATLHSGTAILVVCQARNDDLDARQLSLFSQAVDCLKGLGRKGRVWGLLLGPAEAAGDSLAGCGAAGLYSCRELDIAGDPEVKAGTAARLAADLGADWIFLVHGGATAELGPRISVLLHGGMTTNCTGIAQDKAGRPYALQSVQRGRMQGRRILSLRRPEVIAWQPDALAAKGPAAGAAPATFIPVEPEPDGGGRIRIVEMIQGDPRKLPLPEAERVVAMGRGLLPDGLPLMRRTADALAAGLGCTRPVVDAGILPFERQIGQTGVTAAPRLLLTAGISGANEFTVGVAGAGKTVAINLDPKARIFQSADLGLVGDAAEILNRLLDQLAPAQAGNGGGQE